MTKSTSYKIVVRRIPPGLTESSFKSMLEGLPAYNYFRYCLADDTLAPHLYCTAYIGFSDLSTGNQLLASVEYAPFQKISLQNDESDVRDKRENTIENDATYLKFIEQNEMKTHNSSWEIVLSDILKKEKEIKEVVDTPLIAYFKELNSRKLSHQNEKKKRKKRHKNKYNDESKSHKSRKSNHKDADTFNKAHNQSPSGDDKATISNKHAEDRHSKNSSETSNHPHGGKPKGGSVNNAQPTKKFRIYRRDKMQNKQQQQQSDRDTTESTSSSQKSRRHHSGYLSRNETANNESNNHNMSKAAHTNK